MYFILLFPIILLKLKLHYYFRWNNIMEVSIRYLKNYYDIMIDILSQLINLTMAFASTTKYNQKRHFNDN